MIIQVKVFSTLRHYLPDSDRRLEGDQWEVPDGVRVDDVLDMLHIPGEEARVLLVNGRRADGTRRLSPNDVLHVFPPMCGG